MKGFKLTSLKLIPKENGIEIYTVHTKNEEKYVGSYTFWIDEWEKLKKLIIREFLDRWFVEVLEEFTRCTDDSYRKGLLKRFGIKIKLKKKELEGEG